MTPAPTSLPAAPTVEFHDVRLALGARTVLAGVNLQIGAREFVGVLGPNGAGKTTLMRAVLPRRACGSAGGISLPAC